MKNPRILIADDDRDHLVMLAIMLKSEGYDVFSAFDASHAIALAVEQNPDVILLDVNMGDQGGYDVQERLQQIKEMAQTPVIFITGDQSNWVNMISAGLGAHAVIRKPFDRAKLLGTLRRLTHAGQPEPAAATEPAAP